MHLQRVHFPLLFLVYHSVGGGKLPSWTCSNGIFHPRIEAGNMENLWKRLQKATLFHHRTLDPGSWKLVQNKGQESSNILHWLMVKWRISGIFFSDKALGRRYKYVSPKPAMEQVEKHQSILSAWSGRIQPMRSGRGAKKMHGEKHNTSQDNKLRNLLFPSTWTP